MTPVQQWMSEYDPKHTCSTGESISQGFYVGARLDLIVQHATGSLQQNATSCDNGCQKPPAFDAVFDSRCIA